MSRFATYGLGFVVVLSSCNVRGADAPDFNAEVLPVFRKYCNGCHNAKDAEGGLILEDFARTLKGGDSGLAIAAGKSGESRLWLLVTGQDEPRMPPKDQAAPKAEELAVIKAWIDGGAKPPVGGLAAIGLTTPKTAMQAKAREPITAIATAPNGRWIARSRPHTVEIVSANDQSVIKQLTGHTGQINDISISADGNLLIVAAGETGLAGEATLWNAADWTRSAVLRGHRDAIYAARIAPDAKQVATASYDREIQIWDIATQKSVQVLSGHNDAVYGLSFSPSGRLLATASGDRTVKLWDVATGQRLDTFAQPAKEQYTVAFSPDGQHVAAGGIDCRLRVWQISETAKEGTNPILYARFAHEGPILKVAFSPDGRLLATSSEDRLIKIWETQSFTQTAVLPRQTDWTAALSFSPDNGTLLVGRMNGEMASYPVDPTWKNAAKSISNLVDSVVATTTPPETKFTTIAEVEPNDEPQQATALKPLEMASGKFMSTSGKQSDVDFYRFESQQGQNWILETEAARKGSLADTKIEVLHADGRPVLRAQLQAVRDSWINFRPIDSSSPDVRLEFWEEMDLNQFVYLNGEICKTFRAPQGPDSGFQLYSLNGKRRDYFDTSATAHAKDEPCYIVEAYPPGSRVVENGLPVFPLYFANDDDAERKLDKDSRLTFTAPSAGAYLIKVVDVRGFTGDKHTYTLTVREPRPDFEVKLNTLNPKIPAGSGQRLKFSVNRIDGFEGDVRIEIAGLPAGFSAASPVVIAGGHLETNSVLTSTSDATAPTKDDWERVTVQASATIDGKLVTKNVGTLGEIKLEKPAPFVVKLLPDDPRYTSADGGLTIQPGTTITAKIVVERNGFEGDVKFDVDNLPHGVIVDNIGLSGVLVRAKENERQIFLTARPWVPETSRLIHAVAQVQGNQASPSVGLQVTGAGTLTAK